MPEGPTMECLFLNFVYILLLSPYFQVSINGNNLRKNLNLLFYIKKQNKMNDDEDVKCTK